MTAVGDLDDYIDILGPQDAGPAARRGTRRRGARGQDALGWNEGHLQPAKRQLPAFLARPYALIRAIPDVGTYLGIVLILVGFVLLAVCWGKIAGLTVVGLQMPYLASAGVTGLGLIVTGVAIVSAASRQKDAELRRAQLSELAATLRELRLLLEEPAATALFDVTTELPVVKPRKRSPR